jgi:hypothetical protein
MNEREALALIVKEWELLPMGRHSPGRVQDWLVAHMAPAINAARDVLADKPKHGGLTTCDMD